MTLTLSAERGDAYQTKDFLLVVKARESAYELIPALRASDAQADDEFGRAGAIDGSVAVVGAPNEDGGTGDEIVYSGAAYVFERTGSVWSEVAILRASDAQVSDSFGASVAVDGAVIVVGADAASGGGADPVVSTGAAYVFRNIDGTWTETTILRASDRQSNDFFGNPVSVSGDTIVVSAPAEDGGVGDPAEDAGAVSVYQWDGLSWVEQPILRASDAQLGDRFGGAVAIDTDTIVIGASYEDGGAGDPISQSGAVYVFQGSATSWSEVDVLRPTDVQPNDGFGGAVAIDGDRIVAGASNEDGGTDDPFSSSGSAYLFGNIDGSWTQTAVFRASEAQPFDYAGVAVAIASNTVLMGAPFEDGGTDDPALGAGATFVFK